MRKFGIPTKHNGRQYRSRLEARWAAFFDLCGWRYEYEPFDLKGWIPDFALFGKEETVLVEVKPVYAFPQFLVEEFDRSGSTEEILVLGATLPVKPLLRNTPPNLILGWLGEQLELHTGESYDFGDAVFGRWNGQIGFSSPVQSYRDRISGEHNGDPHGDGITESLISRLWSDSGNKTQWMPPRGVKK